MAFIDGKYTHSISQGLSRRSADITPEKTMSYNSLVPFGGTAKPAAAFAAALNSADPESLADGIGSSYGIIGYKGKVWSLRYRGEKHTFTRPDDNSPIGHIDVIILRQARVKSKSYYGKYDPSAQQRFFNVNGDKLPSHHHWITKTTRWLEARDLEAP